MTLESSILYFVLLIIFPGFVFLSSYSLLAEFVDRKLYARLQNRVGPPVFQPLADFIKLLSKEDIVPSLADRKTFTAIPIFAFAATVTAFLYIPIWVTQPVLSFEGDLVLVLYLLSIPTLALFLAGWHSSNLLGQVGSLRAITQLFSYEVPYFLALLAPALLLGTWSISKLINYQVNHFWLILVLPISFVVGLIALVGKLERIPFDIPEAETEIVAGHVVEYSGRRLAIFRLTTDIEMVVGAALISALFLGGYDVFFSLVGVHIVLQVLAGLLAFVLKTMLVIFALATIRSLFARIRIDQMVSFCYKWLAPLAILQLFLAILVKYWGVIT